jgi:hypothetical protein
MNLVAAANTGTYNPTFGTEITATVPAHLTRSQYADLVRSYLKELKAAHRKHVNWLTACDAYSAGIAEAPKLSRMPSKAAKHRMYDRSYTVNALCGWANAEQTARCGSLGDIAKQIEAVEAALKSF